MTPAVSEQPKDQQDAEQRLNDGVRKPQGGRALAVDDAGAGEARERGFADRAIVADPLDVQEASVGLTADLPQRAERLDSRLPIRKTHCRRSHRIGRPRI